MPRCQTCKREIASQVGLCPFCGQMVDAQPGKTPRSQLYLLIALVVVGLALWRFSPFGGGGGEDDCLGGRRAEVIWKATDPKAPAMVLPNVNAIDPRVTPYVELARLRHTGTRQYGKNNDEKFGHLHQGVVDALHEAGANAFFHARSKLVGEDLSETVTTAVIAHPGPTKRALVERHFPAQRAAMVTGLVKGSRAERGGLRINDILIAVAGQPIPPGDLVQHLNAGLAGVPSDGDLELQIIRNNATQIVHLKRDGDDKFGIFSTEVPILEVIE